MTSPSDILWGKYKSFSGPFFPGKIGFTLPSTPDFLDKELAVVTATEGGHIDAINMYDTCILSIGLIQWCLKVHALDGMLGACAKADPDDFAQRLASLPTPAEFRTNQQGKWRFFFTDGREEVDTPAKMQSMFLDGCTGLDGTWSDGQKAFAKEVAAVFSTMWENPAFRQAQVTYVKPNLASYVMAQAKTALASIQSSDGWSGGLKSAYTSYAANNPMEAQRTFLTVAQQPGWDALSEQDKFYSAMKSMALGSNIGIWPGRYKTISRVIDRVFGVATPSIEELAAWTGDGGEVCQYNPHMLDDVRGVQQFLIDNGFDLGPHGADGKYGPATRGAIELFQGQHGLAVDGVVTQQTKDEMVKLFGCLRIHQRAHDEFLSEDGLGSLI